VSKKRTILATCGGWSAAQWGDVEFSPLQRYALDVTGVTGRRPRVAFVNTASGDQRIDEGRELAAARQVGVDAVHIRLFGRNQPDLREAVLASDLVWVAGGSVANLLAVWRVHGLPEVLAEAADQGTVLAGTSAGAICWHVGGPTTTFGPVAVIDDALGFVDRSVGVHYDSQPDRRPALQRAIADGTLPNGFGLDEGAAVLYVDGEPVEMLTEAPAGAVWAVERDGDGVAESRCRTRVLS
jgi:peptidase E